MTLSADAENVTTKKELLLLFFFFDWNAPTLAFRRREGQCKLFSCTLYCILLMYTYLLI